MSFCGLVRKEFVQRARHSSIAGDAEYAFRHELLRDVAYGEIPRAGKAKLHRRAAEWIDSVARPEDHAELLAHHYLAALDGPVRRTRMSPSSWSGPGRRSHAGLRAIRLSANERAVEHFSRAIALVERLPRATTAAARRSSCSCSWGRALRAARVGRA
jgi:predicted ATPase